MKKPMGAGAIAILLCGFAYTTALAQGLWQKIENMENCYVWNANPQANETVTWTDGCVGGKADGNGEEVWRYAQGGETKRQRYTGTMRSGKKDGNGVLVEAGGTRYEGGWRGGRQHGSGVLRVVGGLKYDGDWRNGRFDGRGVKTWANGDKYDGVWKEGKAHGRGVFVIANGNRCEGVWRDGSLQGTGEGLRNGKIKECTVQDGAIEFSN